MDKVMAKQGVEKMREIQRQAKHCEFSEFANAVASNRQSAVNTTAPVTEPVQSESPKVELVEESAHEAPHVPQLPPQTMEERKRGDAHGIFGSENLVPGQIRENYNNKQ
jgi:hypothetical protein